MRYRLVGRREIYRNTCRLKTLRYLGRIYSSKIHSNQRTSLSVFIAPTKASEMGQSIDMTRSVDHIDNQ